MNQLLFNSAQLLLKGTDRNLDAGTVSSVVITGLVVVFIGLILLIIFVLLYGKIFDTINHKSAEKAKKTIENSLPPVPEKIIKAEPKPAVQDGIDDEIVAVIAAAISAMSAKSGKKIRLKSVKYAKPSRPAWANAGIAENTKPF